MDERTCIELMILILPPKGKRGRHPNIATFYPPLYPSCILAEEEADSSSCCLSAISQSKQRGPSLRTIPTFLVQKLFRHLQPNLCVTDLAEIGWTVTLLPATALAEMAFCCFLNLVSNADGLRAKIRRIASFRTGS